MRMPYYRPRTGGARASPRSRVSTGTGRCRRWRPLSKTPVRASRPRPVPRRSPRRFGSPRRERETRSRSAPRTTRSRSRGASCATASTRSPAGSRGSACGRGDTVALMISNRPEFHLCDLAGMMLGATPFSIYNTYTPEQIALPRRRRRRADPDLRAAVSAAGARGAREPPGPRARDRDRRRAAGGRR